MEKLWASDGALETAEPGALLVRFSHVNFLIAAIYWIGTFRIMSKRSTSSVLTAADRARLKRRMDSPVFRSDSSSEPCEGSDCDLMAPLPLSCVYAASPLVGPASAVGEDELAEWRSRYSLPSFVILLVPTSEERASSYIPGEITVYEDFFDSGLRGVIPALIVGLCYLFEISPSQLNPPAWRILIAIQNLGDLEYLSLGINEVLFAYHLAPLNGGEGRFHLRPRSVLPIVEELPKNDRKEPVFNKKWQERYNFMMFLGSSYRWNFIGDMAGGVANDPFMAYKEAAKVMSAKKGSSSRSASGDEVMITGSRCSSVVKLEPSPSLPGKKPKSGGILAVALSNLNLNVFPQDGDVLPIGDPSEVVQVLQGGLLRTVSQLYHLKERLSSEGLPTLREEIEDLKHQVSGERDQRAARELEIHDLKDNVKDLEKVAEASSADTLATSQKNQELEEEIDALRAVAETFQFEMVMAVNGARVVARWELMRECERTSESRTKATSRRAEPSRGSARRRVWPSRESARPASST
ncbi:hypothetical protein HID58_067002 [Brassica napus]|uniref:Uncharacterized protein n=1 Tax=Brassica napus TaxID=3708 RepID=A0ABQ7ZHN4_BRANA|nr:hypothetical protein HID58_067002 [Brassica napus]